MVVGMAPGQDEVLGGQYFIGPSGNQLKRDLLAAGISMDRCRIQNVAQYWPPKHELKGLTKDQRDEGLAALLDDIRAVEPELIIVLGNEALEAVAGKSGITRWRGSLLDTPPTLPPAKILPTIHPSGVLRAWDYHYLVEHDLKRASAFLRGDDLSAPKRTLITNRNSTKDEYYAACKTILEAARSGTTLACDIEVFRGELACIAFAPTPEYSVSVHADDREVWQAVLAADCPKVWHNAMYDLTFLKAKCGTDVKGEQHDTQLAWHAIQPELACSEFVGKSLAVLVSLFTNETYYKDTLDNWKKVADWNAFYEYNARDSAVTIEVYNALTSRLRADARLQGVYEFECRLLDPYIGATLRGVRIDTHRKGAKAASTKRRLNDLESELTELLEREFNPRSQPQVLKALNELGARVVGTDIEALTGIILKADPESKLYEFTKLMIEHRDLSKAYGTYYSFEHDHDGRVRTNWIIPGTETGRMANSKSIIFRGGANLMTIPRPARPFFLPDDGYLMVYADLSQAEARLVAYLAGCEAMIEGFETGRDIYKHVASQMFNKSYDDITYDERYLAKRCVLGLLYGMGTKTWMIQTNIDKGFAYMTIQDAERLHELFFRTFPEIRHYHRWCEDQLRKYGELETLFGRRREFRTRNGSFDSHTFREAYDYIPQGTVPDIINTGVLTLESAQPDILLLGQIHDAWWGQVRVNEALPDNIARITEALTIPLDIRSVSGGEYRMTIPCEVAIGANWGDKSEDNPDGLMDYIEWQEAA